MKLIDRTKQMDGPNRLDRTTRRNRLRGTVAALTVGAAVSAGVLVAEPARAENTCSPAREASFDTSGFDTVLQVKLCISHGSPTRGAYATVSWTNGGDSAADGDRKFDALVIHYQLQSYSETLASGSCSIAGRVNRNESGTYTCDTAYHKSPRKGGWSADGYISYNLDSDGAGGDTRQLKGSPIVYT